MGFYDLYRSRTKSTLTDSQYINQENKTAIINDFEDQANYYQITKNFSSTSLKVLINEESKEDKLVGLKTLISYPYDIIQFAKGDYINWSYGGFSSVWLLMSLNKQHDYTVSGKIVETNNNLKWRDKTTGAVKSYRCFVTDKFPYIQPEIGKQFPTPDGDMTLYVQLNSDTDSIFDGQRFLFKGLTKVQAYKVKNLANVVDSDRGLMQITLAKAELFTNDDLVNCVPANDYIASIPADTGNIRINPNILTIKQGRTQIYTVYKYSGEIQQADTFTITASGIPDSYYNLNTINENSFSIENVEKYSEGSLAVLLTSNVDGSNKTINIELGGLW
jgi:hypothetical protein